MIMDSAPEPFELAPLKQSKRASLAEAVINTIVGYGIAVSSQMLIFPLFGFHLGIGQSLTMGLIFTVISIVRSYSLRRVFEVLRVKGIMA